MINQSNFNMSNHLYLGIKTIKKTKMKGGVCMYEYKF